MQYLESRYTWIFLLSWSCHVRARIYGTHMEIPVDIINCVTNRIYLDLCRRRGWRDPMYETYKGGSGFTCLVLVNGRQYQTDLTYVTDILAQENAAMNAFRVCQQFSTNMGMLAHNGVVQGLPVMESGRYKRRGGGRRSTAFSSSSSTTSSD